MEDEITSINAIYGPDTLTLQTHQGGFSACFLKLPSVDISFLLHFPQNYPLEPLEIIRSEHVGDGLRKGAATDLIDAARNILRESFVADEPCVFELIEQLSATLPDLHIGSVAEDATFTESTERRASPPESDSLEGINPIWILSDIVSEKKSVFVARAAHVSDPVLAKQYIAHLVSTDKKAAKATHNISAWRIRRGTATFQDSDDDGETAAGGRLLHLLQVMDVWDVVVVVSRWYGGVQLGPDRFRIISSTAREAVVRLNGG